jgi:hypothetical protein
MKIDICRSILCIMPGPAVGDDSLSTSLFVLVRTEERNEANGRMRRQLLLVFSDPKWRGIPATCFMFRFDDHLQDQAKIIN